MAALSSVNALSSSSSASLNTSTSINQLPISSPAVPISTSSQRITSLMAGEREATNESRIRYHVWKQETAPDHVHLLGKNIQILAKIKNFNAIPMLPRSPITTCSMIEGSYAPEKPIDPICQAFLQHIGGPESLPQPKIGIRADCVVRSQWDAMRLDPQTMVAKLDLWCEMPDDRALNKIVITYLDVSHSMIWNYDFPKEVPLEKQRLFHAINGIISELEKLDENDMWGLITFAAVPQVEVPLQKIGSNKAKFIEILKNLKTRTSTFLLETMKCAIPIQLYVNQLLKYHQLSCKVSTLMITDAEDPQIRFDYKDTLSNLRYAMDQVGGVIEKIHYIAIGISEKFKPAIHILGARTDGEIYFANSGDEISRSISQAYEHSTFRAAQLNDCTIQMDGNWRITNVLADVPGVLQEDRRIAHHVGLTEMPQSLSNKRKARSILVKCTAVGNPTEPFHLKTIVGGKNLVTLTPIEPVICNFTIDPSTHVQSSDAIQERLRYYRVLELLNVALETLNPKNLAEKTWTDHQEEIDLLIDLFNRNAVTLRPDDYPFARSIIQCLDCLNERSLELKNRMRQEERRIKVQRAIAEQYETAQQLQHIINEHETVKLIINPESDYNSRLIALKTLSEEAFTKLKNQVELLMESDSLTKEIDSTTNALNRHEHLISLNMPRHYSPDFISKNNEYLIRVAKTAEQLGCFIICSPQIAGGLVRGDLSALDSATEGLHSLQSPQLRQMLADQSFPHSVINIITNYAMHTIDCLVRLSTHTDKLTVTRAKYTEDGVKEEHFPLKIVMDPLLDSHVNPEGDRWIFSFDSFPISQVIKEITTDVREARKRFASLAVTTTSPNRV